MNNCPALDFKYVRFLPGKFLSNKPHYSPTDPDSRIAVKPGKPRGHVL